MRYTYTKTFALLDAWAATTPWDREGHPTWKGPCVGDVCAVEDCDETLLANEECYYVTQLPRREDGSEQAVCWRHVRPDDGPISAVPAVSGDPE
jgi:hypothetical protein